MSCLAAAGADLDRARPMQFALSPSFHEQWSRRSLENPGPLQLAVEEAVRINSLTRHPRGGGWSIYPEIQFGQAPSIVKFLLCQGVSVDKRSRMLLNKWTRRGGILQAQTLVVEATGTEACSVGSPHRLERA